MSYNIQTQKKSSDQQQERLELLKHLIQLYTHHNSSCVPRHVANDMLISITYIAHHATGDASLKKRYVHGLQQLELLCQACKHRLAKVQLYAEWYPNERLRYLLTDFFQPISNVYHRLMLLCCMLLKKKISIIHC